MLFLSGKLAEIKGKTAANFKNATNFFMSATTTEPNWKRKHCVILSLADIRRAIQLQNTATELFYKKQKNINVNIRIILVAFEFACQLANSRK